jgi:chromatin remodeling complex protein RSC6
MTGFNSPVVLSRALSDTVMGGARVMSRSQAASRISAYVVERGLKSKDNGREFRLDAALRGLFPDAPEAVKFSAITGLLRAHATRPDLCGEDALVREAKALQEKYQSQPPATRKVELKVDRRGRHSAAVQLKMRALGKGLFAPVVLSDVLSRICDGETCLSRPTVTSMVWKHIKAHGLQDGADRRVVRTDPLLRELCGADVVAVDCFDLSKYVARHVTPATGEAAALPRRGSGTA